MGQTVWAQCLAQLEGELSPQQFNTWIRPLQAVTDGAECTLLAPNHFVRDWVTNISRSESVNYSANLAVFRSTTCKSKWVREPMRPRKVSPLRRRIRLTKRLDLQFERSLVCALSLPLIRSLKVNLISWRGQRRFRLRKIPVTHTTRCSFTVALDLVKRI